jgi:hypothetical protein
MSEPATDRHTLIAAAREADWQQVVLNGGPPCFHRDVAGPGEQRLCLRAERWEGHDPKNHDIGHPFVSLEALVRRLLDERDALLSKVYTDAMFTKPEAR